MTLRIWLCIAYAIPALAVAELGSGCIDLGCSPRMQGDGICNPECLHPKCHFDKFDCCNREICTHEMLFNFKCDPGCNTAACGFDLGFCEDVCSPQCTRGNGVCEIECFTAACNYDDGDDCSSCDQIPFCREEMLGNNRCNIECNFEVCGFDKGDCLPRTKVLRRDLHESEYEQGHEYEYEHKHEYEYEHSHEYEYEYEDNPFTISFWKAFLLLLLSMSTPLISYGICSLLKVKEEENASSITLLDPDVGTTTPNEQESKGVTIVNSYPTATVISIQQLPDQVPYANTLNNSDK